MHTTSGKIFTCINSNGAEAHIRRKLTRARKRIKAAFFPQSNAQGKVEDEEILFEPLQYSDNNCSENSAQVPMRFQNDLVNEGWIMWT